MSGLFGDAPWPWLWFGVLLLRISQGLSLPRWPRGHTDSPTAELKQRRTGGACQEAWGQGAEMVSWSTGRSPCSLQY